MSTALVLTGEARGADLVRRGIRQRFLREDSGSVAVEFAFVAIPFFGLLLVIVETGVVFLFGLSIDKATTQVARMIQTGQIQQAGVGSSDDFKNRYLCAPQQRILPSLIPCDRVIIDVRTAATFKAADVSKSFYKDGANARFCPGGGSSIVVVRVAFALPVFFPPLVLFSNRTFGQNTAGLVDDFPGSTAWNHLIASAYVVQNEPFDDQGSGSSSCS